MYVCMYILFVNYYKISKCARKDCRSNIFYKEYTWRQLPPIYPFQILTQRGRFLGRVKVRNLVLLMGVTLFQRTKPELRSPTSAIITASRLCNHRLISLEESAGQLTGFFYSPSPQIPILRAKKFPKVKRDA